MSKLPTISTVVSYVLDELNLENQAQKYGEKVAQKVIRGIRELNLYATETIEVAHLRVNEMNCVTLPDDFVSYTKIALNIRGRLWILTLNENISLPRNEECGLDIRSVCESGNAPVPGYGYYFADHYWNGNYYGGMYGVGGGWNQAYYRIDESRNQIVFTGHIPKCEIVLEYKSNGLSSKSQIVLKQQWIEPLVVYASWRMIENNPDYNLGEKRRKQDLWEQQVEMMKTFELTFTADEFRDVIYSSFKQSPKR